MEYRLPERIARIEELAHNLWTSWHPTARLVFRALNYALWRDSGHNPVKELYETPPERLREVASDPAFLALYDKAIALYDEDMKNGTHWFNKSHAGKLPGPVAYFSAEFAFHSSLPIYAGGLGVLAGDVIKEASDSGVPMVGVGLMYPQGYFHQHLSADGWQQETYEQLDFEKSPINPCPWPEGCGPYVEIQLGDRPLFLGVWQVQVGRVSVYLLDTNTELNNVNDRQLSARLYSADREQRLAQEIVLGVGGVRVLRALGISPSVWHCNEGHTSFMLLERVREYVQQGASYEEAVEKVKATSVFTTHTPVPAGHDIFQESLMDKYFSRYWSDTGISRSSLLGLGKPDGYSEPEFNMTVLGLKLTEYRNGVSEIHGKVSRRMWHVLWPERKEQDVPIGYVTNGVHVPTWLAPEIYFRLQKCLGDVDLLANQDNATLCQRIDDIPDEELWNIHLALKRKLLHLIIERAQEHWAHNGASPNQIIAQGTLLDPEPLTIAFVRRFVEYKRPTLLFRDMERLKKIIGNKWRPVQIIFAGKSHPADFPSKHLLHGVYTIALDRDFQGRVVFMEDYDTHIAHFLVHGVDIWLNTPRRLEEASGTSGMKAGMNGILNLSVASGWWCEAYNNNNGWTVGDCNTLPTGQDNDDRDAEELYRLLENEIVPKYYHRDSLGVPHEWVRMFKESIKTILPAFSARRMLKEYTEQMYLPAAQLLTK